MVVVLPAPFGPRMPVTAPRAARTVSPSTAVVSPYRLTSAPISTAGVCGTVLTDASLRRQQRAQRGGVDDLRPPAASLCCAWWAAARPDSHTRPRDARAFRTD